MNDFIEYITVVCLIVAAMGLILLIIGLTIEGLNKLTSGKLQNKIESFFSER